MSNEFDPYLDWLKIPAHLRPPTYYDLLGLPAFTSEPDRIDTAFQKRYAEVRVYQVGHYSEEAMRLLNELAEAHNMLRNAERRNGYDAQLRPPSPRPRRESLLGVLQVIDAELVPSAAKSLVIPVAQSPTTGSENRSPPPSLPRRPRMSAWQTAYRFVGATVARADAALALVAGEGNTILHNFFRASVLVLSLLATTVGASMWLQSGTSPTRNADPLIRTMPQAPTTTEAAPLASVPVTRPPAKATPKPPDKPAVTLDPNTLVPPQLPEPVDKPKSSVAPLASVPVTRPPVEATPKAPEKPDKPAVALDPKTPVPPPRLPEPIGKPESSAALVQVGRFSSQKQVLGRWDPQSEMWQRLLTNAALVSGDKLIVPPTFRPQISLVPGINVTLIGPAEVTLRAPDEFNMPGMVLEYGRALVATDGGADTQLRLQVGDRRGLLRFGDAESAAAVEVRRYLSPGQNPEQVPAQSVVQILAITGRIVFRESEQEVALINVGEVFAFQERQRPELVSAGKYPDWIVTPDSGPEFQASEGLETLLQPERSLALSCEEHVRHGRPEVGALAARCSAQFGEFESFVDLLNDVTYRSYWHFLFDALQEAVVRSPVMATKVRTTFAEKREKDGETLYRLLWGYSPEQLARDDAKQLVSYLEHDMIDVRVLAFENLRRITGKTLNFRPGSEPRKEKSNVVKWNIRLKDRSIVYVTPPAPLPHRAGAAKLP